VDCKDKWRNLSKLASPEPAEAPAAKPPAGKPQPPPPRVPPPPAAKPWTARLAEEAKPQHAPREEDDEEESEEDALPAPPPPVKPREVPAPPPAARIAPAPRAAKRSIGVGTGDDLMPPLGGEAAAVAPLMAATPSLAHLQVALASVVCAYMMP